MTDHEALQQIANLANAQLGATVNPTPPVDPPVTPPTNPGGSCSGANDLSDKVMHQYVFTEGGWQTFCFRCPSGGYVDLTVVPVAGTAAKSGHWSVNGGPQQNFTPAGSDFRFKPIEGWLSPGTYQVSVSITGIHGDGRFGLQATGAVGP